MRTDSMRPRARRGAVAQGAPIRGLAIAMLSLLAGGCDGGMPGSVPSDASRYSDVVGASLESGRKPTDASNADLDADGGIADVSNDAAGEGASVDGTTCNMVLVSSYDQSCMVDTDCVNVAQVSVCPADCRDVCREWAVNRNAAAQYMAAYSQALAQALAGVPPGTACSCPADVAPCCRGGRCQEIGCFPVTD
jgi:hypothetical protein